MLISISGFFDFLLFVDSRTAFQMTRRTILDEALRLQGMGLSVVPSNKRKMPALPTWKQFQTKAADEHQIRDWFAGRDDLGLAIVMGFGDVYARDFDRLQALLDWESSHSDLARLIPTVQTSRGRHFYARYPGVTLRPFADGELRGRGAIAIAPPSKHSEGVFYKWVNPLKSLESLPILDPLKAGFIPSKGSDTDRTESVSVRSVLSVLSVSSTNELFQGTIPPGYGTRNGRLFELARRIKIDPAWKGRPLSDLRPLLKEWHQLALPTIRTKEFSETWSDFVEAYGNVDLSRCGDAAVIAMTKVESGALPAVALDYDAGLVQQLIGLCFELSRSSRDRQFYLSCRKAAAVLGITEFKSVARWLQMLVVDGLLTEVEKGGPNTNRATRYRWNKGKA